MTSMRLLALECVGKRERDTHKDICESYLPLRVQRYYNALGIIIIVVFIIVVGVVIFFWAKFASECVHVLESNAS